MSRVLIVEDEVMVLMMLEDIMSALGHEIFNTASNFDDGLAAAKTGKFDIALLDINLNGELSFPIAVVLRERGIPFVFASGYGRAGLVEGFAGAPIIKKPFSIAELEGEIKRAVNA